MASISFPRPDYNGGFVSEYEHELLTYKSTPDGVNGFPTDPAPVIADAGVRTVRVRANINAYLRGGVYQSGGSDIVLPQLAANTSGSPRIDLVVLRLDRTDYSIEPVVITGTPAVNPVAPSPVRSSGSTGFYDLPLAEVRVANNAGVLAAGDVTTKCWYLGSDGQIRCTLKTLPPVEAGRAVWVHPEGRWLVGTGNKWVPAYDDSGITKITLASGYSAPDNSLQRRNGLCVLYLRVIRTGAALASNTNHRIGTIPAGFLPTFTVESTCLYWSGASPMAYRVEPNGAVYIVAPAGTGISQNRSLEGQIVWMAA